MKSTDKPIDYNLKQIDASTTLYYNKRLHKTFILEPKNIQQYKIFKAKGALSCAAILFALLAKANIYTMLISSCVVYVAISLWFYYHVIPSLNYCVDDKELIVSSLNHSSSFNNIPTQLLLAMCISAIALAILIVLNAKEQNYEGTILTLNYLASIFAILFSLKGFINIKRRQKFSK